jgi:chromosome segregation ATPase
MAKLKGGLKGAKQAIDKVKAHATELQKQVASLNTELDQATAEHRELQTKFDQASSEVERRKGELEQANAARNVLQTELNQAKSAELS